MSSSLVSVFVYLLILISIYWDRRKSKYKSNYIWIVFLFITILGSKAVIYWIHPELANTSSENMEYANGSPVDRYFYLFIGGISLLVLLYRKPNWKTVFIKNKWMFFLFTYLLLSILWSDFKYISIKRSIKLICSLMVILTTLTEKNRNIFISDLFRLMTYILIPLSVLYVLYIPEIGTQMSYDDTATMWVGITTHKNSLGQLAFVSSFFYLWKIIQRDKGFLRFYDICILLMSFWILNGSGNSRSNTSLFMLLIGFFILISVYLLKIKLKQFHKYFFLLLLLYFLSNIFVTYSSGLSLIDFVITLSGRDLTLTGRTFLWQAIIQIARENWLLGVGYGSFWIGNLSNNLWDQFNWLPQQAHNGYIDLYVELGIVGIILFFTLTISSYRRIIKYSSKEIDFSVFRYIFLILILLYNVVEGSFLKSNSLIWFIFLLILSEPTEAKKSK